MFVYRIALPEFIDDLTGTGAKLYGGRWNEQGVAVVYFASSRAMAIMELLVHLSGDDLERDYCLAVFEVPDDKIGLLKVEELSENWKEQGYEGNLKVGSRFVADGQNLLLKVPSVVVEEESNILMNPNHLDAKGVKLVAKRIFSFDRRLKN
ncbi:MAG: RES domain-containing protein [Chitinophagaceae bacterium]|nr:MAG: RES domain-containing protein [Chitinophagaceae bacterium]